MSGGMSLVGGSAGAIILLRHEKLGENAGLTFLAQAIKVSANVNRDRVMQQAVEKVRGQDLVGEYVAIIGLSQVTGHQLGALQIALAAEGEEHFRRLVTILAASSEDHH